MTTTTSHLRCPRCHKRLGMDLGPDAASGITSIEYRCDNCDYTERTRGTGQPWTAAERQERIRRARLELYGPRPAPQPVVHQIAYDADLDPDLRAAVALAESEPVGHLDSDELEAVAGRG